MFVDDMSKHRQQTHNIIILVSCTHLHIESYVIFYLMINSVNNNSLNIDEADEMTNRPKQTWLPQLSLHMFFSIFLALLIHSNFSDRPNFWTEKINKYIASNVEEFSVYYLYYIDIIFNLICTAPNFHLLLHMY